MLPLYFLKMKIREFLSTGLIMLLSKICSVEFRWILGFSWKSGRWIVFECRTRFSKIQRILIFFEWIFFSNLLDFENRWKSPIFEIQRIWHFRHQNITIQRNSTFWGPYRTVQKLKSSVMHSIRICLFFFKIHWIYCYRTGPNSIKDLYVFWSDNE